MIGTSCGWLGLQPPTVRRAIGTPRFHRGAARKTKLTPLGEFIKQTLKQSPRLRATRILAMLRDRGYAGGIAQLRRLVRRLRPRVTEVFVRLQFFSGEQGQVDWAHFGWVRG